MAETPVDERSDRITPAGWLANAVAWVVIAAVAAFIILEGIGLDVEPSNQPQQLVFASNPQLGIMGRMVDGMKHPELANSPAMFSMAGTSTADIERMVAGAGPGAIPHGAIILARMGRLDRARAVMDDLQQRIDHGQVAASPEAALVVADVRQAMDLLAAQEEQAASKAAGDDAGKAADEDAPQVEVAMEVAPLTAAQQQRLRDSLGSSGDLVVAMAVGDQAALDARADEGLKVVLALGGVVCLAVPVGLAGLVVLVLFVVLSARKRTLGPGLPAGRRTPIYAEMFAVWMVAFLLLAKLPRAFLGEHAPGQPPPISTEMQLILGILGMGLALVVALAYLRLRGVTLRQMAQDMAMDRPRLSDPLWGAVGYLMGVALLSAGLVVTLILMKAFAGEGGAMPSHPIQEWLSSGTGTTVLLTFVVASIMAPITEEIVFRGAMYRNLRDTFGLLGSFMAAAISTIVSSVIFAAIHPQGLVFVPVLGALAVAFCLMREWRGSIYPGMWAHAFNNAIILTLNVVLLSA